MKLDPLVLVGGGGHCRSVIDVLELGGWAIAGRVDISPEKATNGYSYLGDDDSLANLHSRYSQALVTVGQIKTAAIRKSIFHMLKKTGFTLPTVVSPLARLSSRASLGEGTVAMHMALVNAEARVGHNCIINSRALVEHDVHIGSHCHIATGAIVNGGVEVGDEVLLGSGSICREGVKIGDGCVVGMGVKVLRSLPAGTIYLGDK